MAHPAGGVEGIVGMADGGHAAEGAAPAVIDHRGLGQPAAGQQLLDQRARVLDLVAQRRSPELGLGGRVGGVCVGEPWSASAVKQNQGFTLATSQAIWPDHPEKVLGCTQAFVDQYPNTARVLVMAILEASRFIEASHENRRSTAQLLSAREYLDAPLDCIEPRLLGTYDDGLGNQWQDPHALRFFADGEVNVPYLSDGMWFMTQFRRWGLLREDPDYLGIARQVQQLELYRQAADAVGVTANAQDMRSSQLIDGKIWDGSAPAAYARSFRLHALADHTSRHALR